MLYEIFECTPPAIKCYVRQGPRPPQSYFLHAINRHVRNVYVSGTCKNCFIYLTFTRMFVGFQYVVGLKNRPMSRHVRQYLLGTRWSPGTGVCVAIFHLTNTEMAVFSFNTKFTLLITLFAGLKFSVIVYLSFLVCLLVFQRFVRLYRPRFNLKFSYCQFKF
jgi:hypothetical protein